MQKNGSWESTITRLRNDFRAAAGGPVLKLRPVLVELDVGSVHAAHLGDTQAAEDLAFLAQCLLDARQGNRAGTDWDAEAAVCRVLVRTLGKRAVNYPADAVATLLFALRQWADWRANGQASQLHQEALTALTALLPHAISKAAPAEAAAQLALLQATAQAHHSPGREEAAGGARVPLESRRLAIKCLGELGSKQAAPTSVGSSLACMAAVLAGCTSRGGRPVEDTAHSRFYACLLRTLTQLVVESKRGWAQHAGCLVEGLHHFCLYGLPPPGSAPQPPPGRPSSTSGTSILSAPPSPGGGGRPAYMPPHRRRAAESATSDSEASDSGGPEAGRSAADRDRYKSSHVRVAMLACLQALSKSDPKALHPHWPSLLPVHQPLQPNPRHPHLFTCMLHDPLPKVRSMAAATLTALMEGPAPRTYLSVAEARTSSRPSARSLTALSTVLGQILVVAHQALHAAVAGEPLLPVLSVVLRAQCAVLAAAPYDRLPPALLPDTIQAITHRWAAVREAGGRPDEVGAVHTAALACVAEALNTSGPNPGLQQYLHASASSSSARDMGASSAGAPPQQGPSGGQHPLVAELLADAAHPQALVRIEALAALKGAATHYPFTMQGSWREVVRLLHHNLDPAGTLAQPPGPLPPASGSASTNPEDKAAQHAVKLLGSCLLPTTIHYCASTPHGSTLGPMSHSSASPPVTTRTCGTTPSPALCWEEAVALLQPTARQHPSYMVRSAALSALQDLSPDTARTCPLALLQRILSLLCDGALSDPVPAVRAAACKSLGSCCGHGPGLEAAVQTVTSGTAADSPAAGMLLLQRCTAAISTALGDEVLSVRMAGTWALANMCGTLRTLLHPELSPDSSTADDEGAPGSSSTVQNRMSASTDAAATAWQQSGSALAAAALKGAEDVDKVRANGIRALGNVLPLLCPEGLEASGGDGTALDLGDWLQAALQVLQSSLTTGNMKVQWNACLAVGLLQRNAALQGHPVVAARQGSLLLALVLLVRDSANYKIRIHAAAALCALEARQQYGDIFVDALTVTLSVLESFESGAHGSSPTGEQVGPASRQATSGGEEEGTLHNYRYVAALTQQLRNTALHLLACMQPADYPRLREIATRKLEVVKLVLQRAAAGCVQGAAGSEGLGAADGLPSDPFGLHTGASPRDMSSTVVSGAAGSGVWEGATSVRRGSDGVDGELGDVQGAPQATVVCAALQAVEGLLQRVLPESVHQEQITGLQALHRGLCRGASNSA